MENYPKMQVSRQIHDQNTLSGRILSYQYYKKIEIVPPVLDRIKSPSKSPSFKPDTLEVLSPSPQLRKRVKSVDVFRNNEKKKQKRFILLSKFLESKIVTTIISLFTLYALFADDFRIICTMKTADPIFDGFTITCLCLFSLEIILGVLVKKKYLFSFFFWLDIISTVSLIIDITSVNEQILY